MNAREPTSAAARKAGWASRFAWLAGRQRGRWATGRGRWFKTLMTAALIVTGLSAWAIALVQPWTARTTDPGLIALTSGVNAERVRSALADVEKVLTEYVPPTPKPLRRNPFEAPRATAADPSPPVRPAVETARPAKRTASDPATPPTAPPTPHKVLETLKGLRLEVILITPAGERWAVINGESYSEGDAVAGLEIVEIQEGRVKLQQAGMTVLLRMD